MSTRMQCERFVREGLPSPADTADQHELGETDGLLRAVADGVDDVVFVKDLEGRYLFINRAGAAFMGASPGEVVGKRDVDFLPPETVERILGASRKVFTTGAAMKVEHTLTGSHDTRTFLSTKAPYRDPAGNLIGLLGIACDVTERKRFEAELRRSHAELSDVLESITDGFYACDKDWRFTYINRRAEEMLRLTRADVGQRLWDVRPDAVGTIFAEQYERVMSERVSASFEAPYQDRWWEVHAYPKTDGISIYFRDVTDRKNAALLLAESEARYRLVAKATSDAIWEMDFVAGRVCCNVAAKSLLMYRPDEVKQTFEWWAGRVHADDRPRVMESFHRTLAGRSDHWTEEYRFEKRDGSHVDILDRAYISRDEAGEPVRMIGAMQDLSDQKRSARIEHERNSLRTAVRSMDRVLGVVGHELRTPLAGLRAMTELLMELPKDAPAFDGFLKAAHDEVVRMAQVVNDLLEVARLNSGTAKWNWSTYGLKQACEEAADSVRPLLDPNVVLSVDARPEDLTARGDGDAVRRLVLNLLTNSYRHTTRGRISVRADAHADSTGNWVKVRVRDTGAGMSPAAAAHLGEAFALNAGVVGDDHVRGSGLGLAICKGTVAAHGGRIDVQSVPGEGTTVTAWLRADLPAPSEAEAVISFSPLTPTDLVSA